MFAFTPLLARRLLEHTDLCKGFVQILNQESRSLNDVGHYVPWTYIKYLTSIASKAIEISMLKRQKICF